MTQRVHLFTGGETRARVVSASESWSPARAETTQRQSPKKPLGKCDVCRRRKASGRYYKKSVCQRCRGLLEAVDSTRRAVEKWEKKNTGGKKPLTLVVRMIEAQQAQAELDGLTRGRRARGESQPPTVCPRCHVTLPATGRCDDCD